MRWLLLLVSCAAASLPPPEAATVPEKPRMVVQLDQDLDTRHTEKGERFTARVLHAGAPEDTRVIGVVTESRRGDPDHDPVLRLRVAWLHRGSCRVRLRARITSADAKEVAPVPGDSYRSGAMIGAVLGGTLLWMPGMVSGFGIGMAGGTVREARKISVDTYLPRGALLTLALDRPVPTCRG